MTRAIRMTEPVKARLAALQNENGQITPRIVVEDARRKDSPLHDLFEWDIRKAALRHHLHMARVILHSFELRIVTETITIKAPFYVRDTSVGKDQGYVSVERLRTDPMLARETLLIEFSRAEGALQRARRVAVALNLEDQIEELVMRILGLRTLIAGTPDTPEQRVS